MSWPPLSGVSAVIYNAVIGYLTNTRVTATADTRVTKTGDIRVTNEEIV